MVSDAEVGVVALAWRVGEIAMVLKKAEPEEILEGYYGRTEGRGVRHEAGGRGSGRYVAQRIGTSVAPAVPQTTLRSMAGTT